MTRQGWVPFGVLGVIQIPDGILVVGRAFAEFSAVENIDAVFDRILETFEHELRRQHGVLSSF